MLRGIAVVLILIACFLASFFSPLYALWSYLWFALFRPEEWIYWDIRGLRISLIFGVMLLVRCFISGAFPYIRHRLAIACIIFVISGFIAQTNATRMDVGELWLGFLVRLVLVTLLLAKIVDERRKFFWTMAVIALSLGFHTAKAGFRLLLSGGEIRFTQGLAGAFIDNNGYALAAVMILPFIIATAQGSSKYLPGGKWIGRFLWLGVPLSCLTVVGLFSRAGFLAMIAAIFTLIILQKRKITVLIVVGALLFAVIPYIPLPEGYQDRIETIANYDEIEEVSALSRMHYWRVALNMAVANPQGVGLKNFNYVYDKYDFLRGEYGMNRSVHNSHLQALSENGFLGGIVWVYLFLSSFRIAFSIRRRSLHSGLDAQDKHLLFTASNAIIASMVGFIIGGFFISLALNDLTWLTFGLLISLDRISLSLTSKSPETEGEAAPAAVHQSQPSMAAG